MVCAGFEAVTWLIFMAEEDEWQYDTRNLPQPSLKARSAYPIAADNISSRLVNKQNRNREQNARSSSTQGCRETPHVGSIVGTLLDQIIQL